MALFLSSIDKNIRTTLSKRESLIEENRTGWFSNRTPWIRFTSMASIGLWENGVFNGDSNLRKKWILYGGTAFDKNANRYLSGYNEMYNLSSNRFKNEVTRSSEKGQSIPNRPMPGITEISIENKGSLGAVREAVINFVCWDKKQLSMLEKLFMTPGISCLLEWGWSTNIFDKSNNKNLSTLDPLPDADITKKISTAVDSSYGHYDALQGPIVDFSWTMRDDGGFDCITTLTSMADTLLAINIHNKTGNMVSEQVDDDPNDPDNMVEDIVALLDNVLFVLELGKTIKGQNNDNKEVTKAQIVNVKGKIEKGDDQLSEAREGRGILRKGGKLFKPGPGGILGNLIQSFNETEVGRRNQAYITWEYLEDFVNNNLCFYSEKFNRIIPELKTNKKFIKTYADGTKIEREYGWINYRKNLLSCDPYICVLPNADMSFGDKYVKNIKGSGTKQKEKIKNTDIEIRNYSFYEIEPDLKNSFFNNNKTKVQLSKILLNLDFVYHTYLETQTLHEFLTTLLNGITDSCGDIWDFQLMIDEEDPHVIYVVDTKTINVDEIKPYQFKVYHKNSVVKNVTLNTEVDQKIKAMMMYGVNKKDSSEDIGTETTYGYKLFRQHIKNLSTEELIPANENNITESTIERLTIDDIDNLYYAVKKLKNKRTPDTISRAKAALNKLILNEDFKAKGSVTEDKKFIALPLKLGITIDGISGIRFGNAIDIDYKPERYSKNCYFQVTNVSQTISPETWETTLDTIMRVDMDGVEGD